jgi:cyclophilin family peptidyl-prolyl cis-trans isomerase
MLQGGDPSGTGKGGESIWGGVFDDEFHSDHKHGFFFTLYLTFLQ